MKSVLISIQPKWCELIASGKKTAEVRKARPKIETPFKCYIYWTKNTKRHAFHTYINSGYGRKTFGVIGHWRSGKEIVDVNSHLPAYRYNAYLAEGKVIGEFVCDKIYDINPHFDKPDFCNQYLCDWTWGEATACLSFTEMNDYLKGKKGYGWHISDLVIYDEPKELSEFYVEGDCDCMNCRNCAWFDRGNGYNVEDDCNLAYKGVAEHKSYKPITRPPQSWCYIEDGELICRNT